MRNIAKTTAVASLIAVLSVGCAGPENKLGRGVRNFTEFTRLGEFSRSVEQTALWDGPQHAYTCLLYTSPSPRDRSVSRMPSSA